MPEILASGDQIRRASVTIAEGRDGNPAMTKCDTFAVEPGRVLVHEWQYVAEVEVEVIDTDLAW